ncbi:MAG: outer membrane protein assembly factor BamE [Pseudomonadota bacterium]
MMIGSKKAPGRVCRALLLCAVCSALASCGFVGFPGVYKINIEQGNLVTQEMIDQLQPGMSRRQVRFIMGSPLIEDTFDTSRWDYPYVIRNGNNVIRQAKVSVHFDGDSLARIGGDYIPEWSADPADATATATEGATQR